MTDGRPAVNHGASRLSVGAEEVSQQRHKLRGGGLAKVFERPRATAEQDTEERGGNQLGTQLGINVTVAGEPFAQWSDDAVVEFIQRGGLSRGVVVGSDTGLKDRARASASGAIEHRFQLPATEQVTGNFPRLLGAKDRNEELRLATEVPSDQRGVDASTFTDVPGRGLIEPAIGEQLTGCLQESFATGSRIAAAGQRSLGHR